MTGRLIVRRVKRLNPGTAAGQDELFTLWRHHAVFVTSRFTMLQAEAQHRDHAIVEQVIADAAGSALAHLPSAVFAANAAWAVLWAISHNLTRAAGTLASIFHARATTATIRAHLVNVPARIARSARRITLHLPQGWPWQAAWRGRRLGGVGVIVTGRIGRRSISARWSGPVNFRRVSLRVNGIGPATGGSVAGAAVVAPARDSAGTDRKAWASMARAVRRRQDVRARTWCSSGAASSFPLANDSSIFQRVPATLPGAVSGTVRGAWAR